MDSHRIQKCANVPVIRSFDCPGFSAFRFLQTHFHLASRPIHRAFSTARMMGCRTFVLEEIKEIGLLELDSNEVKNLGGWSTGKIYRISFWDTPYEICLTTEDLRTENLLGYIIVKFDGGVHVHEARRYVSQSWYVFEGVFKIVGVPEERYCKATYYRVAVGSSVHLLCGVLYCQQNGLNKCCAHVALRSILSRFLLGNDVSYQVMNDIIRDNGARCYFPGDGLTIGQMRSILSAFGASYFDQDYDAVRKRGVTCKFPYQSFLYSGIETGYGAVMNFRVGRDVGKSNVDHAIPVFGHTFDRNTWVADAESTYFELTSDSGHIKSESWVGDFLVHDDNHGCNFSIPRALLANERVDYACAIHEAGELLNPMLAELAARHILVFVDRYLDKRIIWNSELHKLLVKGCVRDHLQSFVLRTLTTTKEKYVENLKLGDGLKNEEDKISLQQLANADFFNKIVVVEVSLPQLFPANQHKIGDLVFDAGVDARDSIQKVCDDAFLFARFPGKYVLSQNFDSSMTSARLATSALIDHIPILMI